MKFAKLVRGYHLSILLECSLIYCYVNSYLI